MKHFDEAKRVLVWLYLTFRASIETNHAKAIKLCERLRALEDKNDTFARSMLAFRYHDSGDDMRAINYANQVLNIDPYDVFILKLLIGIYFDKKEYAVVYAYVLRTLSAVPDTEIQKVK
jgi:tetratricopeptide (TPR) repeat protein